MDQGVKIKLNTDSRHLTDSDLMEITQSILDEKRTRRFAFLENIFNGNKNLLGHKKRHFLEHLNGCPGCLYLIWESLESVDILTETEFASKTPKLAIRLDTEKNFFNVFIQNGFILPLSSTPVPALRSGNTFTKEDFVEAAYSTRVEGVKNLFTLRIRSKINLMEFNIQSSEIVKETFTISFYIDQKWQESQNIGSNNNTVTFSLHYDDIQKNQNIGFSIGFNTIKEVPFLELEI